MSERGRTDNVIPLPVTIEEWRQAGFVLLDAEENGVCDINPMGENGRRVAHAIAARLNTYDDLLAACRQAEELIRDGGVVPIGGVTWQLLRAAIALAEGR